MDEEYYRKARKWYNEIYVKCASERIKYFLIIVLAVICFCNAYSIIDIVNQQKQQQHTYIIFTNTKKDGEEIKITKLSKKDNNKLLLLELMIRKYIINMESLLYDTKTQNGSQAIQKKIKIIKNLSDNNVYEDYINNSYKDDHSDLSLTILKQQKIAKIDKIEYIYNNLNIFDKVYKLVSNNYIPNGARVYFSTETTAENSKKHNHIATILFTFNISNKKANQKIDFNVNNYYVENVL